MKIIFNRINILLLSQFMVCQLVFCQSHSFLKTGWSVTQYSDNIVKVTYPPQGYKTNENISDAVILKPLTRKFNSYLIEKDTIYIGTNKSVVISFVDSGISGKGFSIKLKNSEKIYGGGARALPLNRKGFSFSLDNNPWYGYENGADNLNFSVPFFTSSDGYGLFFDNVSKGKADIGKTKNNLMNVTFKSGELNVYIIFGDSPEKILHNYHKLTGKQGLPPRWALGNFMSRFGYSSEVQVQEIANKMKNEKIPFDAIIYDLFWFGDSIKGTMGNLAWVNKTRWPDPARMIQNFKSKNIKTILITEPFVLKSSKNYAESKNYHATDSIGNPYLLTDFYFGDAGLIDIFRKDARQWFWDKHDAQNKIGVDAWWGDLGEPEKHPSEIHHNLSELGYKRLFKADEVHNMYGHYWTKMLFENYNHYYPDKRLFSLNRSGFAGSQRYNIIPWSGDVSRSWNGLKAQLPIMLGMSMSGIPYMHSDAGGFAGGSGDYELYIRWLQFSSFTPIFRPHGTALFELDTAAYSFPSEPALMPDPYKSMARQTVKLRYKMLPYNYTLSYNQSKYGKPLVAPLYYYYPNVEEAVNIEDQYMWGENIMVVPIMDKGLTTKKCYLPPGKWFLMNIEKLDKDLVAENKIILDLHLNQIYCFVKAGSFIPTFEKSGLTTEDFTTDTLVVHYYYDPDMKSTYTLFDDNGVSKNSIISKKFELITFSSTPSANNLVLTIKSNMGNYPSKPTKRKIIFILHTNDSFKKYQIKNKGKISEPQVLKTEMMSIDFTGAATSIVLTK